MVISEIEHWALLCIPNLWCARLEVLSDLTQVIMLHFHFPTEVLQESNSHVLKWPGITANLSSKAAALLPNSPLITFICYPLCHTINCGEILSAGISLKREDLRTQVIIRVSQLGVIRTEREGQQCRKKSDLQDKSLETTRVSPNVGIISESAKVQNITTLDHSGHKLLLWSKFTIFKGQSVAMMHISEILHSVLMSISFNTKVTKSGWMSKPPDRLDIQKKKRKSRGNRQKQNKTCVE